jgi:hypothetical protein
MSEPKLVACKIKNFNVVCDIELVYFCDLKYKRVTLFTPNLTWTDLGPNPGLRGERPATNLSHGAAQGLR